jgi:Ca2+-binding RTX toxin-like protein
MATRHGNNNDNLLEGTANADDIEGRGGNDKLYGFGGADDIEGGSGNDRLYGGGGNDDLEGGSGNDILDGGAGHDDLEGGTGADTFIFRKGISEIDDFGRGNDQIRIDDALGVDTFQELKALARTADHGEDLIFDFGRHELRLEDTRLSELKASDFDFF